MNHDILTPQKEKASDLEINLKDEIYNYAKKASDWYFTPRPFELKGNGKVYRKLGVKQYKKFLPSGDYVLRLFDEKVFSRYNDKPIEEQLYNFKLSTKLSEAFHMAVFMPLTAVGIDGLIDGDYKKAGLISLVNLIMNVYPILVQRYNRARIDNTLNGVKEKVK